LGSVAEGKHQFLWVGRRGGGSERESMFGGGKKEPERNWKKQCGNRVRKSKSECKKPSPEKGGKKKGESSLSGGKTWIESQDISEVWRKLHGA